jgi:hypothetical protein
MTSGKHRMKLLPLCALLVATAAAAADDSASFIAFGDSGDGTPVQHAVAAAMVQVCRTRGCDFALMLGDNFYPTGVGSVDDPQWQTKFEKPYAALDLPVHAVLGNHDNGARGGDGAANARGDVQTRYRSPARAHGPLWAMRARVESWMFPDAGLRPLARFVALDSSPLTAVTPDPDPRWAAKTYGPQQRAELQKILARTWAPDQWTIAYAHHPYLSNGMHGNAGSYDGVVADAAGTANGRPWKHLFEQTVCGGGADIYFAAHDHDLQLLKPAARCGKTWFIVSGAAARPRPLGDAGRNPALWQAGQTLGFFWLKLERRQFTVVAFTVGADGKPVAAFERTLPKP